MQCSSCGTDSPFALARYALTIQRTMKLCGPCCVRDSIDNLLPVLRRHGFSCWCVYLRSIGADQRACSFCGKRARQRPACSCRTAPRLPGIAAGPCPQCDPRDSRRLYDRCTCNLVKLSETPVHTGDGAQVCAACWVAWVRLDHPWWVKLQGSVSTHTDALRGPFPLQYTSELPASEVAREVCAVASVRRRNPIVIEVRDTELWCRVRGV